MKNIFAFFASISIVFVMLVASSQAVLAYGACPGTQLCGGSKAVQAVIACDAACNPIMATLPLDCDDTGPVCKTEYYQSRNCVKLGNGQCSAQIIDNLYVGCCGGGGSCTGPTGGPCSGTCPGTNENCRPATVANGAACGCHGNGGGGGCTRITSECKKNCNPANRGSTCGRAADGSQKYNCSVCCRATAPAAPTLNSPVNGYNSPVTNITLSWSPPTSWGDDCFSNNTKMYNVYVGLASNNLVLYRTVGESVLSAAFTGTVGSTYYWKVEARNNHDWNTMSSVVRNFRISGGVMGTVYYDANNTCSTAVPWNQGAGMSVRLRGTAYTSTVTNGTGAYNISAPNASYGFMDLQGIPTGFTCSTACGQQCPTKTSVLSPSTGNNFFLTNTREAWWQVVGASIYAGSQGGGNTVRSELPSASTALILPGSGGGTVAALLRSSGTVNLGAGIVSSTGWNTQSTYKGKVTDYNYFAATMGVVRGQDSDFLSDTLSLPSYDSSRDFYYSEPVSGTTTISTPWTVGVGEKYVVFVNGDLNISSNITVPSGGFLAIIAKGNITVSPTVTSLQGIYLTSANFVTTSAYVQGVTNDAQLDAQGSVVAWGTFDLRRDLGTGNNTTPGEKFTYRPDFMANMPKKMKGFAMQWQEVPAGTFGN